MNPVALGWATSGVLTSANKNKTKRKKIKESESEKKKNSIPSTSEASNSPNYLPSTPKFPDSYFKRGSASNSL